MTSWYTQEKELVQEIEHLLLQQAASVQLNLDI